MKKLIIVCEESCRPYGDYLAQLISMEDDTEESVVGVKDGEVAAQVWLEKDYTANAAQLSSNQYILFIGDDKFVKDKSMNMKVVFKKYGIAYGWLGRQAFLSIDGVISENEYSNFINFAQSYRNDLTKLVKDKSLARRIFDIALSSPIYMITRKVNLNKKIKEQQYNCAVIKFYLDSLSEFLGL